MGSLLLAGIRLTTTEKGFLDATPVDREKLVDFHCSNFEECGLECAVEKELRISADQKLRFASVVHSLFLSQYPKFLDFEHFIYSYISLDGAFKLCAIDQSWSARKPHGDRVGKLAEFVGIPLPDWAQSQGAPSRVAALRNESFHEAIYANGPLGFEVDQPSGYPLYREMNSLVCRALVGFLGISDNSYLTTKVSVNARIGLRI